MEEALHALLVLAGAAFAVMVCGSALTFGIIATCRMMAWVPIIPVTYVTVQGSNQVVSDVKGAPDHG
jgi:hypothetical protein